MIEYKLIEVVNGKDISLGVFDDINKVYKIIVENSRKTGKEKVFYINRINTELYAVITSAQARRILNELEV
jgi:hypothetical protein